LTAATEFVVEPTCFYRGLLCPLFPVLTLADRRGVMCGHCQSQRPSCRCDVIVLRSFTNLLTVKMLSLRNVSRFGHAGDRYCVTITCNPQYTMCKVLSADLFHQDTALFIVFHGVH
jgi:hypothetical protein